MVYRHRTQSGRIIKFKNKSSYENWKKGMFANMQTGSSCRKIAKAKKKSNKRLKHKGIGKISSTRKKSCERCKRENLPLTEGVCKFCEKEFAEFKQPEPPPPPPKPKRTWVEVVGDTMNSNWKAFVEEYWEWIKENKQDIIPTEDDSAYIYVPFAKSDLEVNDVQIDYPDYWRGTSSDNWVGQYPIDRHTTKQELLDADIAEETHYWEDDDYNGHPWDEEVAD